MSPWDYEGLKKVFHGRPLPLVFVDLDRFDANVRRYAELATKLGDAKTIRIASKSVRVPELLRRALHLGAPVFRGLMCYSVPEAVFLAEQAFEDLLVAYPSVQPTDLEQLAASSAVATITLTIDSPQHVQLLNSCWQRIGKTTRLRICLDVDVSWRIAGMHFGVQRSPVRSLDDLERLLDEVAKAPALQLVGVLAYEAQIAGVPDRNPYTPIFNQAVRLMKKFSGQGLPATRERIAQVLRARNLAVEFFNGAGTGSFLSAIREPAITEVTVGSGLLQSHLFDYYAGSLSEPAICFALGVSRIPQADRVTCQGGGFIASGRSGPDRAPLPILPEGLRADPREGFGEVQTPLVVPPHLRGRIQIGEPIFFRPAKAGEIAERFERYYLMRGGEIIDEVPTYRGLAKCFH